MRVNFPCRTMTALLCLALGRLWHTKYIYIQTGSTKFELYLYHLFILLDLLVMLINVIYSLHIGIDRLVSVYPCPFGRVVCFFMIWYPSVFLFISYTGTTLPVSIFFIYLRHLFLCR